MKNYTLGVFVGIIFMAGQSAFCGDQVVRTNAVDGSVLIWIPGGNYEMGSRNGDPDETPVTSVDVPGFWIAKYEVTNEQYGRFLAETERKHPRFWEDTAYSKPNQSVVGVRWLDAAAYCKWAGVRLPTEAEWEYVAKGHRQLEYPTATGTMSTNAAAYYDGKSQEALKAPAPVGQFKPNPFGVHDMAGNAWEWTSSLYEPYPYTSDVAESQHSKENRVFRVMRGGAWCFPSTYCRSTHRHRFQQHLTYDFAGIRVAMSGDERGDSEHIQEDTSE